MRARFNGGKPGSRARSAEVCLPGVVRRRPQAHGSRAHLPRIEFAASACLPCAFCRSRPDWRFMSVGCWPPVIRWRCGTVCRATGELPAAEARKSSRSWLSLAADAETLDVGRSMAQVAVRA